MTHRKEVCEMDRLEVRVSITKVLLCLIVVIVPLSVVGLILTQNSDRALDNAIGNNFRTMAQIYSNDVSDFMLDRVHDVMAMSADPVVIQTVANANKSGGTKRATNAVIEKATSNVATGSAQSAAGSGLQNNSASQVLRLRRDLDPRFLRIVATDENGTVVAATYQPSVASYAQNEVWQATFNKGQGAIKIADILYDEFTKAYYVTIGVPISGSSGTAPIGVLSAAVNITSLLSRFQQNQLGNGARVMLVKDDGSIVSGPSADVFAHTQSQEFVAVRDSIGSLEGTQAGWSMPDLRTGPHIVGYANTGLKKNYDNLGWFVVVSQEEHQAAAPIRQLVHFALAMVILGLLMVTLLGVYYYLHRTQRFAHLTEEELPETHGQKATA
jgi:Cache domain